MATSLAARSEYGSFKDSLKAPIHRWFTYPAGYSYKLVESSFNRYGIDVGDWVADPFLGTGTTSLTAKFNGINSVGVEAHPYVHRIAVTKMSTNLDTVALGDTASMILERVPYEDPTVSRAIDYPELIYKCFTESVLQSLSVIRQEIAETAKDSKERDFFDLALASTLRQVTTAGAGWPYIAPSKHGRRRVQRDPIVEFQRAVNNQIADLNYFQSLRVPSSVHRVVCDSGENITAHVPFESVDLIVTSPPYLNNYDYADRTRLETYFLGIYKSWGEITARVRDKLMTSATTQVRTGSMQHIVGIPTVKEKAPQTFDYLSPRIEQLSQIRRAKAGRKTYDFMVAGYFEDMLRIIRQCHRVLKPGASCVIVIGDSAPYGIHIETEQVIGLMAVELGFSDFSVEVLRERGSKWANNSQRHSVQLKESILTITK